MSGLLLGSCFQLSLWVQSTSPVHESSLRNTLGHWDVDNANVSGGESTDENDDDDDDNDDNNSDNNDGVGETEGEPGAAAEEPYVEDDDELSLIDDDNDFSVAISDMDSADSEATENDGLWSASYKIYSWRQHRQKH